MSIQINSFLDFTTKDWLKNAENPTLGEVAMSSGNVSGKLVAPGVLVFDSGVPGFTRIDSAGVHGDEVDGQIALSRAVQDLIDGKVTFKQGKWIVSLVNLEAMRLGQREKGYNANRLAGPNGQGKADGTYERARVDEVRGIFEAENFGAHSDWHGTIQATDLPFGISSIPQDQLHNPTYRAYLESYAANFGLPATIVRPYGSESRYSTFEYASALHMVDRGLLPRTHTVELGQIGTEQSSNMINNIHQGLVGILENNLRVPSLSQSDQAAHAHATWRISRQIIKDSDRFTFKLPRLANFMELPEGVFATDGNKEHITQPGEHLVFPHPNATVGEQACFLVKKEEL